ncbi:MAG TPA: hypothetical protein V6D19_13085 [Stenomitos sp.]
MKKIFSAEYPNELSSEIEKWISEICGGDDLKVYRPQAVVELFDQDGNKVKESNPNKL